MNQRLVPVVGLAMSLFDKQRVVEQGTAAMMGAAEAAGTVTAPP